MNKTVEQTLLFSASDVKTKVKRLSYQILEDFFAEDEIHLIGIDGGGKSLSNLIAKEIKSIKPISILKHTLKINKKNPLNDEIELSVDLETLNKKVVILVDDVSNTGRTLFYALKPLLTVRTKTVKVVVLVDRQHKQFPIQCDYVGNSLSTTMKEHIDVYFEGKSISGIYLS